MRAAARIGGWLRFGTCGSCRRCRPMAALNAARYGSPLASGYGSTDVLFSLAHVGPNLARYPRWLIETQTPLIVARATRAVLRVAAPGPARLVLARHGVRGADVRDLPRVHRVRRLVVHPVSAARRCRCWLCWAWRCCSSAARGRPVPRAGLALAVLRAIVGAWCVPRARMHPARVRPAELNRDSAIAGRYRRAARCRADAVVIAVQQSGSIRYYGGRPTLAWDAIAPGDARCTLDAGCARTAVRRSSRSRTPRSRDFGRGSPARTAGALDWPPSAEVSAAVRGTGLRPSVRAGFIAGARVETQHVLERLLPQPRRREI